MLYNAQCLDFYLPRGKVSIPGIVEFTSIQRIKYSAATFQVSTAEQEKVPFSGIKQKRDKELNLILGNKSFLIISCKSEGNHRFGYFHFNLLRSFTNPLVVQRAVQIPEGRAKCSLLNILSNQQILKYMFTYLLCKYRILKMMDILRFVLNKINTSKQHVVVLIFLFFHELFNEFSFNA